ncbi:MAG: hypothetical protein GVY20_16920 [Bacteroidetes bacterium]|jgi:hypothetical protein|nr:hypothetical protein [Bacteroidota bacterium]
MKLLKLNYRTLIYLLLGEYSTISRLFEGEQKYEQLLRQLKQYVPESVQAPYQKDLLELINLSRHDLMELMNDLYTEFKYRLCEEEAYKIKKTQIWLLVDTKDGDSLAIGIDVLNYIPHKGELIFVPLIHGERSIGYFTVKRIEHEFSSESHTINIFADDFEKNKEPI